MYLNADKIKGMFVLFVFLNRKDELFELLQTTKHHLF